MSDLISKQDVKWQIQEWINELNEAIDMLDSIPSAEPKRGEWIEEITGNGWNEWVNLTCDQCGSKFEKAGAWLYCPVCGAKMRGEEE